jgi:hypothetical protein
MFTHGLPRLPLFCVTLPHLKSNHIKSYPNPKQVGNRIFVITPYDTNNRGRLSATVPDSCPVGYENREPCQISINHHRDRQTGPCFPLAVVYCKIHDVYFTLYPPGHYPYGRQPLVEQITVNSEIVEISTSADDLDLPDRLVFFRGSLFDAALDADLFHAWPKEGCQGSLQPRFNTQLRLLDRAAKLLGISLTSGSRQRELITEVLDLPGQLVSQCSDRLSHQSTFKKQGQSICRLLRTLKNHCLFERFVQTGSIAGLWPPSYFTIYKTKRLKRNSFHALTIRGSPS